MSTRAIQYLELNHVNFDVAKYDHKEKGVEFAAKAVGFSLEKTIKTLVVDTGGGSHRLTLVPGSQQLSLKRFAKMCSAKRAVLADISTAERLTGYLVGGISPFGIRKDLPAILEKSLLRHDVVAINAGQRGVMLIMAPQDIVDLLDCPVFKIVDES